MGMAEGVNAAVDYLKAVGAKKVNIYPRAGRNTRITFAVRGAVHGVEFDPEKGVDESVLAQLRDIVSRKNEDDPTYAAKGVRAPRDLSTGGARLKYAREEATLSRTKLADYARVDLTAIKIAELEKAPLENHFSDPEIVAIAREINVSPNWLAGRDIVAPPPAPIVRREVEIAAISNETLGQAVQRLRIAKGYSSQVKFAEAVGCSGPQMSWIENNKVRNSRFFPAVATALDVSLDWLKSLPTQTETISPVMEMEIIAVPEPPENATLDFVAIGARIAEFRHRNEWSQARLGGAIGLLQGAVSRIENGKHIQDYDEYLSRIAKTLGCEIDWLKFGQTAPAPIPVEPADTLIIAALDNALSESPVIPKIEELPAPPMSKPLPVSTVPDFSEIVAAIEEKSRSLKTSLAQFEQAVIQRYDMLAQRLNAIEQRVEMRYEALAADIANLQRYERIILKRVRRINENVEAPPPRPTIKQKREKDPVRVARMKAIWARRLSPIVIDETSLPQEMDAHIRAYEAASLGCE